MVNSPYISVIVPCYNGERFIKSAIHSVLNQPSDGVELIVVNDGSSDNTAEACKSFGKAIRYFETENLGAGHARNYALKEARGCWVIYLDADDLLMTNSISSTLIKKLHVYEDQGVDVIYTSYIYADMALERSIVIREAEDIDRIEYLPKNEFWSCIYRREYLIDKKICFYEYKEQDIATAFRYLVLSKEPKATTDRSIRFYLQRNNPTSNTNTWKHQVMHAVKARVYFDLYKNHANEASLMWLFETFVIQLYEFYKCVASEGYISRQIIDNVNCLLKEGVAQDVDIYRRMRVKRVFLKTLCYYIIIKLLGKQSEKQEIHSITKKTADSEDLESIMHKLRIVSEFAIR